MKTEAAALWRAVRAAPHDDAPRLVYADWLDDHGQPERAEFIRLQCLAAAAGDGPRSPREAALWARHAAGWRAELPPRLRRYPFHRGFVRPERMALSPHDFAHLKAKVFAAAPSWDVVFEAGPADALSEVVGSPRLRAIDGLELLSPTGLGLSEFLAGGALDNLRSLQISGLPPDEGNLDHPGPGRLPRLRRLGLSGAVLGPAAVDWVVASGLLPSLEEFRLEYASLDGHEFRILLSAPHFQPLTALRVCYCRLTPADLAWLVENPTLSRLRRMDLSWNAIGDEGAMLLALWPNLRSVQHLSLQHADIGPAGVETLLASPFLPDLRTLSLAGNPAARDPATLSRLRARFGPALQVDPDCASA